MKTIYQIRFTILSIVCLVSFGIHSQAIRDSLYDKAMHETLIQLDSAGSVGQLQECKNRFERIAQKYSDEWLPLYYVAYCDVNSVFYDIKSSRNEMILMKASKIIEELYAFPNAGQSEVNTLKAYCLTAMIAMNPQGNGQKYSSEVIQLYERAIAQDPENPRPVILLADFEQRLPAFLRSDKRNPDEERAKAALLFEKEEPNIEKPYWGKFFLKIK